jgi:hypothetical protein
MYSHVLAAYQKTLLVFWAKTSKTMSAVAESFKGYQYYEFTVIKDLAEPSRLLAEKISRLSDEKTKEKDQTETDDALIDISESSNKQTIPDKFPQKGKTIRSIEFLIFLSNKYLDEIVDLTEPVNALIDITDSQLDDQLLELEKLTTIDQTISTPAKPKSIPSTSDSGDNLVELLDSSVEHDKLFSDLLSPLPSEPANPITNDLFGTNSFDADWTAAFGNLSPPSQPQIPKNESGAFLPSSLLNEILSSTNKIHQSNSNSKSKPTITNKSNWLDLFAELDPIQNPDAIGKLSHDEFDRNC